MGTSFVFEILEIGKQKEPDWKAGSHFISSLNRTTAKALIDDLWSRSILPDKDYSLKDFKAQLRVTLREIRRFWRRPWNEGFVVKTTLARTKCLIAGGTSYGEAPTPVMNVLTFFLESGMAKACGFLTR